MTYRRPQGFTERSHRVIELAISFAAERGQSEVNPLDITIGLIREGEGVAATALRLHGFDLDTLERELAAERSIKPMWPEPKPRFTSEAQGVLDRAREESLDLGHVYVGTEHLLLALVHNSGTPASVLGRRGFTSEVAKTWVRRVLNSEPGDSIGFVSPTAV
jgi:ATP-dependent Clp protease ATP-binding subunit ClpC